jgi:hypothetical protein
VNGGEGRETVEVDGFEAGADFVVEGVGEGAGVVGSVIKGAEWVVVVVLVKGVE